MQLGQHGWTPLLHRASWHTVGRRPGPRRGHTAARAFRGGPVQFANHAISCCRGSEAVVGRLTGPVIMLATMGKTLAGEVLLPHRTKAHAYPRSFNMPRRWIRPL